MISYTSLYGLYILSSTLLFYALLLLARYARQIKSPPEDAEFSVLLGEKQTLLNQNEELNRELENSKTLVKNLEQEVRKLDDALKAAQNSQAAAAVASAPPS